MHCFRGRDNVILGLKEIWIDKGGKCRAVYGMSGL